MNERIQAIHDKDYYWFPNQKMLAVHRENVDSKTQRKYLIAYTDNLIQAMFDLSPSAFKVYLYLLMNKDGYRMEYSPSFIAKTVNVSKDTARDAFKQMERKGYFDRLEDSDYKYNFYEVSRMNTYIKNQEIKNDNSELAKLITKQTESKDDDSYIDYPW